VPVPERVIREPFPDRGDAGLVRQRVPEGGGGLAAVLELGPHLDDGRVQRNLSTFDQLQREQPDDRLADGVEVDQGVGLPCDGLGRVRPSADEVHHDPTVDHDTHAGPDLSARGKVLGERGLDRGERGVAETVDGSESHAGMISTRAR
jgi:hypothetical protein